MEQDQQQPSQQTPPIAMAPPPVQPVEPIQPVQPVPPLPSQQTPIGATCSARELLGITMQGLEEDGEEIPSPTPLPNVEVQENERVVLVDVYMPSVRMAHVNRSISRTVTLPAWLNSAALERGVNFSQVLQDALKRQLGL